MSKELHSMTRLRLSLVMCERAIKARSDSAEDRIAILHDMAGLLDIFELSGFAADLRALANRLSSPVWTDQVGGKASN